MKTHLVPAALAMVVIATALACTSTLPTPRPWTPWPQPTKVESTLPQNLESTPTIQSELAQTRPPDPTLAPVPPHSQDFQITRLANGWSGQDAWRPIWSPDGTRIAFVGESDGYQDVYVVDLSGQYIAEAVTRTWADVRIGNAAWSPDGNRIACDYIVDGTRRIYVMLLPGSGISRVFNAGDGLGEVSWSPDGNRIAYVSNVDGVSNLHVAEPRGTEPEHITRLFSDGVVSDLAWSPDGSRIAYASNVDGNSNIRVVKLDGSERVGTSATHARVRGQLRLGLGMVARRERNRFQA